ncbi:MAG: hypothetical protein LBI79_03655 [Nitrososphaerota archaeon]|jgi:hypothetical protein|nr:hypothetical protein [Nitrososphaerota archaeon]
MDKKSKLDQVHDIQMAHCKICRGSFDAEFHAQDCAGCHWKDIEQILQGNFVEVVGTSRK